MLQRSIIKQQYFNMHKKVFQFEAIIHIYFDFKTILYCLSLLCDLLTSLILLFFRVFFGGVGDPVVYSSNS